MPRSRSSAPNPFRYGALAFDEAFTDREAELRELKADILNGQDVVIFAPRRYGKSSLVLRAVQELARRGVLTAQVDLMTAPTKEKLAEKLASEIHRGIASRLYRARERALGVFRGLRITPTVTIDPEDTSVSFGFEPGRAPADVDATLERLLTLPGELGSERERRVALVLDEFQEVVDLDPELPKLMRAVFQTQPEVAHIYLGSKRHLLRALFNDENEPFWRSAKQLELGVIRPDLFAPFIAERFRATGKRIDDAGVAAVLDETAGHPYATQELCYFAWEATDRGETATPLHVRVGLAGVLRSEHAHFSLLWDGASAGQRLVLAALATEPGRPYSEDYRRRHRLPPATNVQKALAALVRRELVGKDSDGTYRIVEPFFAEWVVRNREPAHEPGG
jgi:uncharacterized protein